MDTVRKFRSSRPYQKFQPIGGQKIEQNIF